jgi:hypothetical protein
MLFYTLKDSDEHFDIDGCLLDTPEPEQVVADTPIDTPVVDPVCTYSYYC